MGSIKELVHAEIFSDFLDTASYLLEERYKDPAAVIGGAALESHLRQLCIKHEVDAEAADGAGIMRAKKAERMNQDLAKVPAYGVLDQKNVTAWLDLRNKAAHGRFAEYTKEQVGTVIGGVREFIARLPA